MVSQQVTYRITEDSTVILQNVNVADPKHLIAFLIERKAAHAILEETQVKGESIVCWLVFEDTANDNNYFFVDGPTFADMLRAAESDSTNWPDSFLRDIYCKVAHQLEPARGRDCAAGHAIHRVLQWDVMINLVGWEKNKESDVDKGCARWMHVMEKLSQTMVERYRENMPEIIKTVGDYQREYTAAVKKRFPGARLNTHMDHNLILLYSPGAYTYFMELGPFPIERLLKPGLLV